jgi:hypothetical protein
MTKTKNTRSGMDLTGPSALQAATLAALSGPAPRPTVDDAPIKVATKKAAIALVNRGRPFVLACGKDGAFFAGRRITGKTWQVRAVDFPDVSLTDTVSTGDVITWIKGIQVK